MRIIERYSAAVHSDNLAVDERTVMSDTDVLGAAGLAARSEPLGVALTRFFAGGKAGPVVEELTILVFKRARTVGVKLSQVQAVDLSTAVLGWYRHGTCQPCGGTGYQLIPGTPSLGDECTHCHGTGRLPFDRQFHEGTRDLARWLSGEIDRSQTAAGRAAMTLIAPKLDL